MSRYPSVVQYKQGKPISMKIIAVLSLTALTVAPLLTSATATARSLQAISVRVNGSVVPFADARPQSIQGRVLVPLRGVLEQIGADINWNEATQTVKAQMGQRAIELQLGSRTALINGETVSLAVPAMRISGSTMVPLRFLGEALGATVDWDAERQQVDIRTEGVPGRDRDRNRDRAERGFNLRVDGREESFGTTRPFLRGEQVMVPLERTASFAKFSYRYDADENTFTVRDPLIKSIVGSRMVEKEGRRIRMDNPSELRNGILYVPLEFIALASEYTARWNANTRTITLATTR